MIPNYQFSDIIGSTYKNGPVQFMPNGFSLLCSNGNRLKSIDLKTNLSYTSNVQSTSNITCLAINKDGTHAFIASERSRSLYVNLYSDIVLHTVHTTHKVKALSFSPDSRFIAIGAGGTVKIYSIAETSFGRQFDPFTLVNKFRHSTGNVTCLDWSSDSRLVVAGGEDSIVKVFGAQLEKSNRVGIFTFGETAALVAVWFNHADYGLTCVDRNGKASIWEGALKPQQLVERGSSRLAFSRTKRIPLYKHVADSGGVHISAAAINKERKLLVAGFTNGVFCIFELSLEFTLLQNFRAGEHRINTIQINCTGDWLAIGCGQGSEAQLLVWEWQSESYILRQQSHSQRITAAAYSPDGSTVATGAEDGKVKLWKCSTSLCLVTFTEHQTGVTDVCFTQSGKAILSASLEGSIRAHDLKRYRNFRTLVAPKQTQLNLLCADSSGDIVMASSRDQFEIYIWALETGQLLDVLTGHADICMGMATFDNTLCSVSLDKTLKFWNILKGSCLETVHLLNEGLDVKYSPTGSLLAVLCYDSSVSLFDTRNCQQVGSIETKLDIDAARQRREKVRKAPMEKNKSFTCIAFSPNGQFLLAGGQSNVFCLYSVADRLRVRSFKLSSNLSFDGVALDIDYRKITEFGNLDLFDLTDSDEEERTNPSKKIRLPGTRHTDLAERAIRPVIAISRIAYSPTGQDFAVVSSEGVHIFTVARIRRFNPFQLQMNATPDEMFRMLRAGEYTKAVSLALILNDGTLIGRVVQSVPVEQLRVLVDGLGFDFAERMLAWIAAHQSGPTPNRHFHFYLLLIKHLLYTYGADFKRSLETNKPTVTAVQQLLANQQSLLMNTCDRNVHSLEYILMARSMAQLNS